MITNEYVIEQFKKGFDCGQIVVSHFAEELGITDEQAKKIAAGFGAGTFKSETCGAVLGAYVVLGLKYGHCTEGDSESKGKIADKIKAFDEKFISLNNSEVCKEILGYDLTNPEDSKLIMKKGLLFSHCPNAVRNSIEIIETL